MHDTRRKKYVCFRYHGNTTGTIDVQLIRSQDGVSWGRTSDRTPFLPSGEEYADWDPGVPYHNGQSTQGLSPPPVLLRLAKRSLTFTWS